jgi:ribosomal protein S18 acetylase RimI-like enzyme
MKTKQELMDIIKNQLAIEYNCSVNDFSSSNNIITVSRDNEERRHYINGTFFFQMVTFGDNVVITANECIHDWLKEYTKNKKGHWIFEHTNLVEIDKKLNEYNKKLRQTHHMFLSHKEILPKDFDFKLKWFENEEINQFYDTKMFPNAFCTKYNPKRPDVLAVAAYDEGKIIGMAGCSADTPLLWQIGIDVNENYRGKGIGTYLVTLIKNEIEKRGKIPFYGTSLSNLYSWSIALNSGFTPVWIEIETIEEEKNEPQ